MTNTQLPECGLVFWPVGSGDSTTVVVDDQHVIQIDIRDMAKSDDPDALVAPVVDRLVESLPERDERPYLSAFVLTHADKDHCTGFGELLERVLIGEMWVTPRLWRELGEGASVVCEDARVLHDEAIRRVTASIEALARGEQPGSGDRILIVGYDEDHDDHAYSTLPAEYHTGPGHLITAVDGDELAGVFGVFVHGPFVSDCDGDRNGTSLALQITLTGSGAGAGRALLLGDLAYDGVMKVFKVSEARGNGDYLDWDILLAPHHCSSHVMYLDGVFQSDVMDAFADHAGPGVHIVASAREIPPGNHSGDNPPHAKAKNRYLDIVDKPEQFVCTAEWPSTEDPRPITFGLGDDGFELLAPSDVDAVNQDSQARESITKSAAVLVGLAAAPFALEVLRRFQAKRSRIPQQSVPGLVRARQAVEASRGPNAEPSQPTGYGRL